MPASVATCALCGMNIVNILDFGFFIADHWMHQFRAVYAVRGQREIARLSRPGINPPHQYLITLDDPADRAKIHLPDGVSETEIDILPGRWRQVRGFSFHTCCWEILSATATRFHGNVDTQAIFDICTLVLNKQCPLGSLCSQGGNRRHMHLDLVELLEKLPCCSEPTLYHNSFTMMSYQDNPLDIPQLRCLWTSQPEQGVVTFAPHQDDPEPEHAADGDPFSALPLELKQMILVEMDSKSVANLRLASPAMAATPLHSLFWRSRFWPGKEFGHIYEAEAVFPAAGNWSELYKQVKLIADDAAIVSRRRLWRLSYRLCELIDARRANPDCLRPYICDPCEDPARLLWAERRTFGVARGISHPIADYTEQKRIPEVPQSIAVLVGTSYRKQYITGICFRQQSGRDILIGYWRHWHGDTFEKIEVTPGDRQYSTFPTKLHIAFDSRAVRSIGFSWPDGAEAGTTKDGLHVSWDVLAMPGGRQPLGLEAGFRDGQLVDLRIL
ncbi:hypothetical protein GGR52DRAFT_570365 [Hypoxylon sp. FL1284]|nr:hypothetical protein GGR52DRAFT_570365 [Hypoxylon sp. FL1284]